MHINELDYWLPEDRIAQQPVEPRDHSRLLVVNRADESLDDRHFYDLPDYLAEGDVLVLNDTRVIPARIFFQKPTRGKVEGLFLRELEPGTWEIMFKGMARLRTRMTLAVEGNDVQFTLGQRTSPKSFEVRPEPAISPVEFLNQFGQVPLPPYIHREHLDRNDRQRYQTVFSQTPGAVAAPTAGLHFTDSLLDKIKDRGVQIATVTLHVGLGTFEPVAVENLKDHVMHREWYRIGPEAAETINTARAHGNKIVPVGTTSVRVLETAATDLGLQPGQGWTDIFIYPPYRFKIVDRLITNFHLPKTTLLALVYAFAGINLTRHAYQHAIESSYRFFSYGDAMLIL